MGHDLRKYARQTNARLVVGFILILLLVGDGLIYLFYGRSAAATGLFCLLASLAPVVLILLGLWIMDLVVRVNNRG